MRGARMRTREKTLGALAEEPEQRGVLLRRGGSRLHPRQGLGHSARGGEAGGFPKAW